MLNIIKLGDPDQAVLFQPTGPVKLFNIIVDELVDEMTETMREAGGLGLAAPQIGVSLSIVVLNDTRWPELINPRIVHQRGSECRQEMCLSAPGLVVEIERAREIVVEAQDRTGKSFKASVKGEMARLFQHEIDHLQGVLITRK